jgi:hypothetical protein
MKKNINSNHEWGNAIRGQFDKHVIFFLNNQNIDNANELKEEYKILLQLNYLQKKKEIHTC